MALIITAERRRLTPNYDIRKFLDAGIYRGHGTSESWNSEIAERIQAGQSTYVYGQLGRLCGFVQWAKASDLRLPFVTTECGGEFVTSEASTAICGVFGPDLVAQFGCREVGVIGYCRNIENRYKVAQGVYTEIVDDTGAVIREVGRVGRVVVTSLVWETFTIIRFETGDYGSWCGETAYEEISLEPDRQCSRVFVEGVGWVSGTKYFKGYLEELRVTQGVVLRGPFKVRVDSGRRVMSVYVTGEDMGVKRRIITAASGLAPFSGYKIECLLWKGWSESEKRSIYVATAE